VRYTRLIIVLAVLAVASLALVVTASGCGPASSESNSRATAPGPPATSLFTETPSTTQTAPPTTQATPATVAPSTTEATAIPQDVKDAAEGMSLEAKAAQVLLVTFDGTTMTAFTQSMLGKAAPAGVLLLGRNVKDAGQLRALTAALQKAAVAARAPGLFVAADEEGGAVLRVKDGVPVLPAARALGTNSTPAHAQDLARATAAGLLDQGVNMVLAPVADVVADKGSFLFTRSYGDDPGTVSDFVAAVTQGFTDAGVMTVVKHFPGHGSAPENSHTSAPVSSATVEEFAEVHLPPFHAAITAGTSGVMLGHFVVPAYDKLHPASQSSAIIDDLLRRDLGFEGLVVSDDLEMSAAASRSGEIGTATQVQLGEAAVAALAAGCDLLITTGTYQRQLMIRQAIVDAVTGGSLSREELDQAVERILALKAAHSLPLR
jgi:beta-N-acetylhexosaminidase